MVKLISICLMFVGFLPLQAQSDCSLSVEFTNIRSTEGKLFVFLYNYENQYPKNPFQYFEIDKKNISNHRLMINIPGLANGNYAISVIDDENNNDDLDFFLGIPTEGYAFSNNILPLFSLPSYEDLLFSISLPKQLIRIKMRYAL